MPQQLIGREKELESIVRLLDRRDLLPGTAVLHGQAGIGKTSLWLAGIDMASSRGFRTLACRTFESETTFSYVGLADLLGAVADAVLSELPTIQRRALEAALLIGESETQVDERTVAAAFLAALRLLAADATVCLAVDDVQWLDDASLSAVRFALSRLDDEPIATLLTVRGEPPAWIRRGLPVTRLVTVELDGLSIGALHELLRTRLDVSFPRPTLVRLSETSGGNPLFALELAVALRRHGGALAPGEALPIPSTVDELLGERIRGLGTSAIEVARVVAAAGEATVDIVEAVLGDQCEAALAETLDAKILERDGAHLRFTIRCSAPRSQRASPPRIAGRCMRGSRRSFRPRKNGRGTSRSRRPSPTAKSPRFSRMRHGPPKLAARRQRPPSWRSRRAGSHRRLT